MIFVGTNVIQADTAAVVDEAVTAYRHSTTLRVQRLTDYRGPRECKALKREVAASFLCAQVAHAGCDRVADELNPACAPRRARGSNAPGVQL